MFQNKFRMTTYGTSLFSTKAMCGFWTHVFKIFNVHEIKKKKNQKSRFKITRSHCYLSCYLFAKVERMTRIVNNYDTYRFEHQTQSDPNNWCRLYNIGVII